MSIVTEIEHELVKCDGNSQSISMSTTPTVNGTQENLEKINKETHVVSDIKSKESTGNNTNSYLNSNPHHVENDQKKVVRKYENENKGETHDAALHNVQLECEDERLKLTCNGINGTLAESSLGSIHIKIEAFDEPSYDGYHAEESEALPLDLSSVAQVQKRSSYLLSDALQKPLYRGAAPDNEKRMPTCPACQKTFASRANLFRHMPIHSRILHECKICFRNFNTSEQLEKHQRTQHIVQKHGCNVCDKVFNSKSNLYQHAKVHLDVKPFNCDICKMGFAVNSQYQKHMAKNMCMTPEERIHKCLICKRICKTAFLLRSHLKMHSDERPYACDKCDMCFKYKSALRRHLQLHNNDRPFMCDHCDKTFTAKGLLVPHLRMHTGEKPYTCHVCQKKFRHQTNVKRHLTTHSRPKRVTCELCHKTFPRPSRLKYHMRSHAKEKPFGCADCGQEFSHKQNVVRHYERKHPGLKMSFKLLGYSDALFNGEFTVGNTWSEEDKRIIEAIQAKGKELLENASQTLSKIKLNDKFSNFVEIKQEIPEGCEMDASVPKTNKDKTIKHKKRRKPKILRKDKCCKELKHEIKKKKEEFLKIFDLNEQNGSTFESEDEKTLFEIKMEVKSHEVFIDDIKKEHTDDFFYEDTQEVTDGNENFDVKEEVNGMPFEIDFEEIKKSSHIDTESFEVNDNTDTHVVIEALTYSY